MNLFSLILTFIWFFSLPICAFGTNTFQNPQLPLDITSSISYLYDSTGSQAVEDIQTATQSKWLPLPSPVWFGTQNGAFWLKFSVRNVSDIPMYITFPYPFINKIDIYSKNGNSLIHQSGGFTRPFCSRSLPLHLHNFNAPSSKGFQDVWVRLENNFPIVPVVQLASAEYLYQAETTFTLIQGIYVGIMLALFLYNLILYINIRESVYGYYLLYLICVFIISFHHSGLTCQYIWPCYKWLWLEAIVNFSIGPAVILFANSFLNIKENAPWMYRIFVFVLFIYLLYFIFFLIPEYNVWINNVLEVCHSVVPFLLFGVSIYIYWKKKFYSARYYILGWTIFLLCTIILFRIYGGQLDFDPLLFHSIEFGSASEALLFSFALADRIRSMNREKRDADKKQMQLETLSYQSELKALKAQMNPHFVFNSLSSLQSLIVADKKDQAMSYLNDFSKLTRQTLDNATKTLVPLSDEIAFLKSYSHLETLRFEKEISVTFELSEDIDPEMEKIPPMIIQPYVENAFKHGFTTKKEPGEIRISIFLDSFGILTCTIVDNGIGRKESISHKNSQSNNAHISKAMEITDGQVKIMNKLHSAAGNYSVEINDLYSPDGIALGTKVIIKFASLTTHLGQ